MPSRSVCVVSRTIEAKSPNHAIDPVNQSQPSCSAGHRRESMRKTDLALLICLLVGNPSLFAQKRVQAGVFLDYLDVSQTSTNNFDSEPPLGTAVTTTACLEGDWPMDTVLTLGGLSATL